MGYSKVKAVHVYVWAGLTIIFSFERILKLNKWLEFTHTSPMTDPEFILFSLNSWVPKFVRAVKCFRLLQIHLEELEAGGFNVSYLELLPLDQMLCVL